MKANQIKEYVVFKRNVALVIVSSVMAMLFLGLAVFVLIIFEFESGAVFLALLLSILSIPFIRSFIIYFHQPSKVTITGDNKVIIGKNEEEYLSNDVRIGIEFEPINADKFVKILLMGWLPGILLYISNGMYRVVFKCEGNKTHTLSYASPSNIIKLLNANTDPKNTEFTEAELKLQEEVRKWEAQTESRKNMIVLCLIIMVVAIAWVLLSS